MRKIKFRTKDEITNQWYYGMPQREIRESDKTIPFIGKDINAESYFNMFTDIDTISQYTGLKDKNGKEIYEGDIVKYTRTNMYAPMCVFHNKNLVSYHYIYWNEKHHSFYQKHYNEDKKCIGGGNLSFNDDRADENIIEVIGNVYDNPEMLDELKNE